METLEGKAADDFHELRMELDGRTHVARSASSLGLLTESGDAVVLEMDGATLVPNVDEHDDFGSLLERGLAEPFLDRAPGDHVKVRIVGLRVERGAPLAVRGEVERGPAAGDGYRDGGEASPRAVVVRLAATGERARAALELEARRPPDAPAIETRRRAPEGAAARRAKPRAQDARPSVLVPAIVGAAGLVLLAWAGVRVALHEPLGRALALVQVGALACALSIFFAARARFLPDLRTSREDRSGEGRRTGLRQLAAVPLMLASAVAALGGGLLLDVPPSSIGPPALGGLAVIALALALGLAIAQRRALRRLWLVARAAPVSAPGRWGALDGRVTSGTVRRQRAHTLEDASYTDANGRRVSNNYWTYEDHVDLDTLEVALDAGGALTVATGGAALAAEESRYRKLSLIEEIRPGDRVRVVCRPTGEALAWHARGTGPESLFVFGSRRSSAQHAARRAIALHALAILALLAITGGAIAGAIALSPS